MDIGLIFSITIGVLSMLVLVLIGWQVYTLLDIRKIHKEVNSKRLQVNLESERNMCVSALALSDFYYSLLVDEGAESKEFKYVNYRIAALLHSSRLYDYDTCSAIVRALLESITDKLRLSKYNKSLLLHLLQKVEQTNKIENFQSLLRLILNIQESD